MDGNIENEAFAPGTPLQLLDEGRHQCYPPRDFAQQDVFVQGMCTAAVRTQAIEGRATDRRGQIAIAPSAGLAFTKFETKLPGQQVGLLVQSI